MKTSTRFLLLFVLLVGVMVACAAWYNLYRVAAQPAWIKANVRDAFLYGSVDRNEKDGIPYWIWLALPRRFPEYLPGPGGYASLGFSWEETVEMPAGFAKQTVGYVRVAGNCAMCHAYSVFNGPDAAPTVFAAGPGHTAEVHKLLDFYKACAQDPRFDADNLLDEVSMATKLSFLDKLMYRYILIPRTRERMLHGDAVMLNQALWQHSQNPGAQPVYRKTLQDLDAGLSGVEKAALDQYLQTLR
jgi:hypothetical protein